MTKRSLSQKMQAIESLEISKYNLSYQQTKEEKAYDHLNK